MFNESAPYPRTSIGNNLSDLSRRNSELICGLIKELVGIKDRNADWIAHRACRNLVKKDPVRVMNLLGVDVYRYKDRYFRR
jgi:3-methyladenine DNA glycosylase AlkC